MKNLLLLILMLIVFVGCKNETRLVYNTSQNCVVDVDNSKRFIDISNLFEDKMDVICLETKDECLIADIRKVQYTKDFIFVSDRVSQCVFLFSHSGKYIKRIGHRGDGPDDYAEMGDFTVAGSNLFISDLHANKILCYKLRDNSVRSISLGNVGVDELFSLEPSSLYCISNYRDNKDEGFNLYQLDLATGRLKGILPSDKDVVKAHSAWGLNRHASRYKEYVSLIYPWDDAIYKVTSDSISVEMSVRFSNRFLPEKAKYEDVSLIVEKYGDRIWGMDNLRDLGSYLLFEYGDGDLRKSAIINKRTYDCMVADRFILKKWGGLYITDLEEYNDTCYVMQQAYMLKQLWEATYSKSDFVDSSVKVKMENICHQLKDENNPVIFKFQLKKDK